MRLLELCSGHNCPIKEKCQRYNEVEDPLFPALARVPYNYDKKKCEFYIKDNEQNLPGNSVYIQR